MTPKLIVIAGPTGVGKSALALHIAQSIGGEIVNYDSVQIYSGFDIGSAKPSLEERSRVPHHLYDIVDADAAFNAADYGKAARAVCDDIHARGRRAILAGGTFFYLRALLSGLPEMPGRNDGLRARIKRIADRPRGPERLHRWLKRVDPVSGARIAAGDRHRVERALEVWLASGRPISTWERNAGDELPAIKIGLTLDRQSLAAALDARVESMYKAGLHAGLHAGLIDETRALLARYPAEARPFGTIGYKEAAAVTRGEMSVSDAIAETKRRTRAYAKRQLTWLRSERNMHWIASANEALPLIEGLS